MAIKITVLPADVAGIPGDGGGVGGSGEAGNVDVDVGQGVIVGRMVGVPVGCVGVGVYAGFTTISCPT